MLQLVNTLHRVLVADPACLERLGGAARVAHGLGLAPARIETLAADAEPTPGAGELCVLLYDLRFGQARALAAQAACLARDAAVLLVGMTPGAIQVGPAVRPGAAGCLHCLQQRARNNRPRPRPRSGAGEAARARPRPAPGLALTAAASALALDLVARAAAALQDEEAQGGQVLPARAYLHLKTDSLQVARHRFLEVPGCMHCPATATATAATPAGLALQPRLKARADDKRIPNPRLSLAWVRDSFVDRHSGLVKHVFQNSTSDLMPLFSAEMATMGGALVESGYGRADTFEGSELVAILEAVERYAGGEPRGGRASLRASHAHMQAAYPGAVADPESFILHGPAELASPHFRLQPYSGALEFDWSQAVSLRHRRAMWIPDQLAYYSLRDQPGRPLNRFVFDSSNGCSMGGCIEEAMLGGLYEVVERDAYLATWYTRIPPTRIANGSVDDPRCAALIARAEADGFEIHLFDITTDVLIPAVWAMIVDPRADAVVKSYCASGCSARWGDAVFAALVEVTTSIGVYRRTMAPFRSRAEAMLDDDAKVVDITDHVLLYSLPEAYARLDFLQRGPTATLAECEARLPSLAERDLTRELQRQCAKVLAVAADILVVDQGFPALEPLGLHCAKMLVPGLLPVTFGHQYRRIDYARLNRVARFKGMAHPDFSPATVNPYPHNFP